MKGDTIDLTHQLIKLLDNIGLEDTLEGDVDIAAVLIPGCRQDHQQALKYILTELWGQLRHHLPFSL